MSSCFPQFCSAQNSGRKSIGRHTIELFASVLFLILPFFGNESRAAEDRPNIVMFYIDDFGWRDTGFNGSQFYDTPFMDQIAREGINFTSAYSNAPNCAPSRACLMSGLYTPRHGVYTVGNSDRGKPKTRKLIPTPTETVLPGKYFTLPEMLKTSGYHTAFLGKWHLGDGETGPLSQGFDLNFGGLSWGHPKTYFSPYRNPKLKDGPRGEYLTDRLNEEADQLIRVHQASRRSERQPFFVCLSHYAVHTPIQAKKELVKKYEDRAVVDQQKNPKYAAMIESVDEGIGMILNTLEELKIDDQTLVILYSDNGGMGGATSNAPLRGAKGMMYEGGIRVPLAMRWPGVIKPGIESDQPVIGTDLFPTFAELSKAKKVPEMLDGKSLLPLMTQTGKWDRDAIFWHFPAYLQGKYSGARNNDPFFRTRPASAIRMGNWKLIQYFEDEGIELFNLEKDISETTNLAAINSDKKRELLQRLKSWQKSVNAPIPTQLNPKYESTK